MARGAPAPPPGRWGTLDAFLVPVTMADCVTTDGGPSVQVAASPPPHAPTPPPPPPPRCVTRHALACASLGRRTHPHAAAAAARVAAGSLVPLCAAAAGRGPVVSVRFDSGGELLALALAPSATTPACVALHSDAAVRGVGTGGGGMLPPPLLTLGLGAPPPRALAWTGEGDGWVAVLTSPAAAPGPGASTLTLAAYAVDACAGGAAPPTRAFGATRATAAPGARAPPPLTALAPAPAASTPHTLVAADARGYGHLFDVRVRGAAAVALFRPPRARRHGARAARAAVLAAGAVLAVASDAGDVVLWDVRSGGGSGGGVDTLAALAAPRAAAPPLATLHLPSLIAAVPGLAPDAVDLMGDTRHPATKDVGLGPPTVLEAEGGGSTRLAFQTGCGWTGALDASTSALTHIHAPPAPHARHGAVHGGWGRGSGQFVAPALGGGLVAVDARGRASPALVPWSNQPDASSSSSLPAATRVALPAGAHSHATCVAVSPASGEVVAGTACGRVCVFGGAV